MLATFYAKALDADLPNSLLHDTWAKDVVEQARLRLVQDDDHPSHCAVGEHAQSRTSTRWTRQFLAVHPRLDRVASRVRAGQSVLPHRSRARRRVVRRRLPRRRRAANPAVPRARRAVRPRGAGGRSESRCRSSASVMTPRASSECARETSWFSGYGRSEYTVADSASSSSRRSLKLGTGGVTGGVVERVAQAVEAGLPRRHGILDAVLGRHPRPHLVAVDDLLQALSLSHVGSIVSRRPGASRRGCR